MRLQTWLRHKRTRPAARGQSLVEFAIVLPFLLLLILGAIEFGFVFESRISLQYASREGARVGSQLVNGGGPLGCPGTPPPPGTPSVDEQIIAAVNRVITSSGSPLDVSRVTEIRLYKADLAGNEIPGLVNVWLPTPGAGPPDVDGRPLDFSQSSVGWPSCIRTYVPPVTDSIGVGVRYVYQLQTPFLAFTGVTNLPMYDTTIMAMNPTN